MPDPQVSAIICTHNRSHYLGAAIDSSLSQDFTEEFEVIVVDNASSDRTREVVAARLPHPRLHYVYEPTIGLSVARNRGAKLARSPVFAYLDDDAVATPRWLQTLHRAHQNNAKLVIAGGKVILPWAAETQPPRWLSPGLAANLGAYDLGNQEVYIDCSGLTPRGLNYSIRRSFLNQVGGFDVNLGRIGKLLLSNEELCITELALERSWQVAYLPDVLVAHNIAPERLRRSWFLDRGWWQGISECYREQHSGRTGWKQFSRGSERLLRGLYRSFKCLNDPAKSFDSFTYAYGQIGYLKAAAQGFFSSTINARPEP